MSDLEQMLTRQAEWQKSRQSLTWPEKIRMAERVLASVRQWHMRPGPEATTGGSQAQPEGRAVIRDH